jgi:hypothetical protein
MNQQNHSSDIFDTFWNNAGLRGELFGLNIDPKDEILYLAKKNIFIEWVRNQNPLIFNFIEIK